ncbi:MAG: DUF86 domain-containing protein [Polaribacter sp.]
MDEEIKVWLYDIYTAIIEIESFFEEGQKIYDNYCNDIKTKRAVEREIEIIGEATNRILKKDNNFNITNARKIVDTRNRIIHGYDSISDDMIWSIVINNLPKLKIEVRNLLKE